MRLVDEVQGAVFSGKVVFEKPRMIKIEKGRERGVMQYREVASFDRLSDRVILSRMTAYVRDRLEANLTEHCYSFRRGEDGAHRRGAYAVPFGEKRSGLGCRADVQRFQEG